MVFNLVSFHVFDNLPFATSRVLARSVIVKANNYSSGIPELCCNLFC